MLINRTLSFEHWPNTQGNHIPCEDDQEYRSIQHLQISLSLLCNANLCENKKNQGTSKRNRCNNVIVTESQTYHWKCFHQLLCDVPEVSFEQNPWGQQFLRPVSYCQGNVYSHADETAELLSVEVRFKQKSYPHLVRKNHSIIRIVFSSVTSSNHDNIHRWWHYSRSPLI